MYNLIVKNKMGWDYSHYTAYGLHVRSLGNFELRSLLEHNTKLVGYIDVFSGTGMIFIYFISTFKTICDDHGSYAFGGPDTSGDAFNPPDHPIFTKTLSDKYAPELTEEEIAMVDKIENISDYNNKWTWMEQGLVDY